jgi:hypothetical protein
MALPKNHEFLDEATAMICPSGRTAPPPGKTRRNGRNGKRIPKSNGFDLTTFCDLNPKSTLVSIL